MQRDLRAARGGRPLLDPGDVTTPEAIRPAWAEEPAAATQPTGLVSSVRPRLPDELDRMLGRSRIRTTTVSAKRWAPVARVVHGIFAVVCAVLGVFFWLAFYDAKAALTVLVLMWILATAPLAVAALLAWRAVEAHRRTSLPTDEALEAVLLHLRGRAGRVTPAEVAAQSGLGVAHVSEALEALARSGSCRPVQTRDGFLVYEFALEGPARRMA
jgi:hypothetical protein